MTANQKIAVLGIVAAVVTAFLSPIVYYNYKVDLCLRQMDAIARSWNQANSGGSDNPGGRIVCYKMVNGSGQ